MNVLTVASVEKALSNDVSPEEFMKLYGREKPHCDQVIIFSCKTGRRAGIAADTAVNLGYTK